MDWKIQENGTGWGREFDPTWGIEGEGLSEEFWMQRTSNFRKYNSSLELRSNRAATKNRLCIPKHQGKKITS